MLGTEVFGELVGQPVGLGEVAGVAHAGFLPQLAHHRRARILIRIDAALGHLPFEARQDDLGAVVAKAMADQDKASRVEQRDSDMASVRLFQRSFRSSMPSVGVAAAMTWPRQPVNRCGRTATLRRCSRR